VDEPGRWRTGGQAARGTGHQPRCGALHDPLTAPSTSLVTTIIGQLAGLPPVTAYLVLGYLLARLLIPVLLIVLATRSATPTQRIGLVRDYLLHVPAGVRLGSGVRPSRRRAPGRRRRGS
jgi:hypothetical protein